jgi:hypothetical protein
MEPRRRSLAIEFTSLAVLCLIAYAPSLTIPLLEDDYPNLAQAQSYGGLAGLPALFGDAVFRLRATSYWAMSLLWQTFHLHPWGYHLTSLAIHVANSWLVYLVGTAWPPMRAGAFWAAALFAVHEGHQEAVMWFSAINELLMFLFGAGALFCFLRARSGGRFFDVAGLVLFALALLSKESAVILAPLFLLASPNWRVSLRRLLPYAGLAAAAVVSIWATRSYSFRFSDGSFSVQSPFWITWPHSMGRMLWIWGGFSAVVILASGNPRLRRGMLLALAWMAIALLPYVFLTYSTAVPSRQTYLASAGIAFLCGLAISHLAAKPGRKMLGTVLALMLLHNTGILWTRKRRQFLERAEPTEQLIRLARGTADPIWVRCFPRPALVAEEAVRLALGRPGPVLVWHEAEAARLKPVAEFCYTAPQR